MKDFSVLPQIDKVLNLPDFKDSNKDILLQIIRNVLSEYRELISNGKTITKDQIIEKIKQKYKGQNINLKRLINATGVIIHTNMGRSPISKNAYEKAKQIVCGYSNLEYDIDTGSRGNRYDNIGKIIANTLGCENALIVNNNAAAVFLVLNTLAKGANTIISRGELVEIGGSFRVPEVMKEAGTNLIEVGTTNKTKPQDYEKAIDENTKLILKVHRSNFDIVGFTQSTQIQELCQISQKNNIPFYYDLGAGYIGYLPHNLGQKEPDLRQIFQNDIDLISFSGDKLLGSVQCGIIAGKDKFIKQLKQNQLLRMLRVDKFTIAILEQTLLSYSKKDYQEIPILKHMQKSTQELIELANYINSNLTKPLKIIKTSTYVGGGSLPNKKLPSIALEFKSNPESTQVKFRKKDIIGRIENDKFILDLRCILDDDVSILINAINIIQKDLK